MIRRIVAALAACLIALTPAATVAPASAAADPADPLVILVLGDSISELDAPSQPELDWQEYLSDHLDAAGIPHVIHTYAHGGWRCADWLPTIRSIVDDVEPDLTIVACGTNDAAHNPSTMDAVYASLLTEILLGHAPTRILASWVQYSASRSPVPAGLRQAEAAVNDAIFRQVIGSVHGTRILSTVADFQRIPEMYLDAGGIHPTAAGYQAMAAIVYRAIRQDPGYASWPDIVPEPCGMIGARPGYPPYPTYLPCDTLAG